MALTCFYTPRFRADDANGNPVPFAKLKFFEAGTVTPLPVYADVDGNTSLGVVVTADAGGLFAQLFMLPQAYDIVCTTTADVTVWTAVDFFPPAASSASNSDITATAGVTFAAGEVGYISDGSGALNAGQMYKADADLQYASGTPMVYIAVSAVDAGDSGLFREGGLLSGLSGLTPGDSYYVSGTAGAMSSTPGTFRRFLGQAKSTTELYVQTNPPVLAEVLATVDGRIKRTCDGRLTLTSGLPVTIADVTAATTVYFALYAGNVIALYSGTEWVTVVFSEMSVVVPNAATQMYDVFVDYNDGTPQLVTLPWTNDSTRATALTKQDGVFVKTGDTQQRYVGSFRTTSVAGQTEDSEANRLVYNYYNRVVRGFRKFESTASWTYTTSTWRQARATTTNKVTGVQGVAEDPIHLTIQTVVQNSGAGGPAFVSAAIGLDSTTAPATPQRAAVVQINAANEIVNNVGEYQAVVAAGYHEFVWLERSEALGTTTWYSNDGIGTGFGVQSGIMGQMLG
jgi:hypothetical protein